MNTETAIAITIVILALVLIEWGYTFLEMFRERKYHREYMRSWRADRKEKELQELRKWKKNTIIVNDMNGRTYGLAR